MSRILAKGSKAGVQDDYFDWDEEEDLKSYNIAFYDLPGLVHEGHRFLHPWFDEEDALYLPSRDDVTQFLGGGNDLVIILPGTQEISLRGKDREGNQVDDEGNAIRYECDLLEWLPFGVGLNSEDDGNDLVELLDGFEDWSTCFSDKLEWEVVIDGVGQRGLYGNGKAYNDPRPEDRDPDEPMPKAIVSPSKYGPEVVEERIAIENVNRTVASKVSIAEETQRGELIESPGSVYLIPEHPGKEFDEYAQDILSEVFDIEVEPKPEWVSDYSVPGEDQLRDDLEDLESQIADLEEELERAQWYQQLLFANDNLEHFELEEPVREAFREVGLQVGGEKSGERDGGIPLEDETIILEVTGRRRGVRPNKIDKMDDHVQDAENEGYCENGTGLLVYNPYRTTDPKSRSLNTRHFEGKLEEYGYKFMTSLQVYQMLSLYKQGEINTGDIENKLTGEDLILEFGDVPGESSEVFESRIEALRSRLNQLL